MGIGPKMVIEAPAGLARYLRAIESHEIDERVPAFALDLGAKLCSLEPDQTSNVPSLLTRFEEAAKRDDEESALAILEQLAVIFSTISPRSFQEAVTRANGVRRFASEEEVAVALAQRLTTATPTNLTVQDIVQLVATGQTALVHCRTYVGDEFSIGHFKGAGTKPLPIPKRFHVFQSIELQDFSQFSASRVRVDQDFLLQFIMACALIARDPARYLDYHYLNHPKYDGTRVRMPEGAVKVRRSIPPDDFFKVKPDERLFAQRSNDGRDIIFTRQQGENVIGSQIFFIFRVSQLQGINITLPDLSEALQKLGTPLLLK